MELKERIINPEIFQENRLNAHSDHEIFRSADEYIAGESSFSYSLNGKWKFSYASCPDMAIEDFYKEDYPCKNWDSITVPAHIQLEDYDVPQYANVEYPWEGVVPVDLGEVPKDFNPIASYVRYFHLPVGYEGKSVILHLDGVEQGAEIWLNGEYIGYTEDSFTAAEFDLSKHLKSGENKLAIRVYKWTSAAWLEDQDFFRFSGIFRDIYIYALDEIHLRDLKLVPRLDETFTNARLSIFADILGKGEVSFSLREYSYDICDMKLVEKNPYLLKELWSKTLTVEGGMLELTSEIEDVLLWSAENPRLYLLCISLKSGEKELEFIPQLVGFRDFRLEDGLMKINGKRIVFHGVNRHDFACDKGRVPDKSVVLRDIITMKQNNINAIRTSHYPNASYIYKLCDIYGIYMIDEANLETHGTWSHYGHHVSDEAKLKTIIPSDDDKWLGAVLDRANSMYERDKNHPSILFWSCGNESYGGKVIYEMSQLLRKKDDIRLVHYEGISIDNRYPDTSDIYSQMYTPAVDVVDFLEKNTDKPLILCEYTHAMGNSNGAMYKYIRLSEDHPRYQGGFIWDFADQALRTKNVFGEEYMGYGGDFGDRPHSFNFSGNGIVFADHRPTPKMQEVKYNYQQFLINVSKSDVQIMNKSLFTNTRDFIAVERLYKNGVLVGVERFEVDVEPLSSKSFELPITVAETSDEYTIIVSLELKEDSLWAKAGHELAFGQAVFGEFNKLEEARFDLRKECEKDLILIEDPMHLGVRGRDFSLHFNKIIGGLASYRYGGKELLKGLVLPNFWRAPVDNDIGNIMPQRYAQWKVASQYIIGRPTMYTPDLGLISAVQEAEYVEIKFKYMMPTKPESSCMTTWKVFADGTVEARLAYEVKEELGDMPEFGFIMRMPRDFENLIWYGYGKENTYKDVCDSAKLGIYENKVKDNLTPYLMPQESGAKMGVRYATLTDKSGSGMMFWGEKIGFSALPYTPHEIENAYHSYELPRYYQNVVRVFSEQMGVGGDNSWGAKTHPEHLVDVSMPVKIFTFRFCGI